MPADSVIRIKPNHYIHVLDNNSNVTGVIVGPLTFTRQEHQHIIIGPEPMITVPPRHYCKIANPVMRDPESGKPLRDQFGQFRIKHGDEEIRFAQDPFPLYPGETLKDKPQPLAVVNANQAIRIKAVRDFDDGKIHRVTGDEWLFKGPGTYTPRIEETVAEKVNSIIIKDNEALKIRARYDCVDCRGVKRVAGEQWLVRQSGAYLPDVNEEVLGTVAAVVLTPVTALHLVATNTFIDVFGKKRKAGEEWLITMKNTDTYITDVYEQVKGVVKITTLNNRQFCVVVDAIGKDGKPRFGCRELRKGEASFFLYPGERLESGIQEVYVLAEEEALLLRARSALTISGKEKRPGDRWMIYGPCDFIPPVEVEVVERRHAIPLDENEGIYVRDITTGKIRAHIGSSYMLKPNEELWAKVLPPEVDTLLRKEASRDKNDKTMDAHDRDATRVVAYRVPHGAAVQVYDYEKRKSRVVFGPDQVLLQPDEHFTTLNMSGGIPKTSNQIQAIALFLGPDFMTDQITVETADHARLSLKLSYNWHFEVSPTDQEAACRIFSTPDFVGDLCKALSSRVRGVVAQTSFDQFHKHSVDIIQESVFGRNPETNEINDRLVFTSNNLVVTNIDIQSVEPVDQRTRDSLQKSVQLAIEITTKSQEATARQEAERLDQEARGRLERQKLADEAEAERSRKALLELQAQSAAVESTGQATAEARALAEASKIEGEAAVTRAALQAQSSTIASKSELEEQKKRQAMELDHKTKVTELDIKRTRDLAEIETTKFAEVVNAIGPETLKCIAQAGPEMQAKLLSGLGLKSLLITDGNSPINLFNTAQGLVSGGNQ